MESYTYEEALKYVIRLSDEDKLELFKFLASVLLPRVKIAVPRRRILEFEGKGENAWKDIDVEKHIEEERNSWAEEPAHSLLELEGLGAEHWEGIDPQKYVEDERDSWR